MLLYNMLYYLSLRDTGMIIEEEENIAYNNNTNNNNSNESFRAGLNEETNRDEIDEEFGENTPLVNTNSRNKPGLKSRSTTITKKVHTLTSYPSIEIVKAESVFFVIGKAIPEGDTTYVLVKDKRRNISTTRPLPPTGATASSMVGYGPEFYLVINPWTGMILILYSRCFG